MSADLSKEIVFWFFIIVVLGVGVFLTFSVSEEDEKSHTYRTADDSKGMAKGFLFCLAFICLVAFFSKRFEYSNPSECCTKRCGIDTIYKDINDQVMMVKQARGSEYRAICVNTPELPVASPIAPGEQFVLFRTLLPGMSRCKQ